MASRFRLGFLLVAWYHTYKLCAASPPSILPGLPWPQGLHIYFVNMHKLQYIGSCAHALMHEHMQTCSGLQGHDDENYPFKFLQADASPDPILIERYQVLNEFCQPSTYHMFPPLTLQQDIQALS